MSFFLSVCYIIIEYARPQEMYEYLSNLPLAEIVIILIAISFLFKQTEMVKINFTGILMLAYLFCIFVSFLFAFRPDLAWNGLVDFIKWTVIYFVLVNTINERNRLYIFLIIFLLLNFKYAQFAVRVWAEHGFYSSPKGLYEGGGIGSGFFKNPNDLGVALNSVFGISFYMIIYDEKKIFNWVKMRWFHLISTFIITLAILSTSSRGAALGFLGVLFGIWYKSKKKLIVLILIIVVMVTFISLIPEDNWYRFKLIGSDQDETGQQRVKLWNAGIRMAKEYPLTGVGPYNFIYVNRTFYNSDLNLVQHNIYVQAISELGFPGIIIFLMMIFSYFYNQKKTRTILKQFKINDSFLKGVSHGLDICMVGFMINGFFITVLYYPFFWILLIFSIALRNVVEKYSIKILPNSLI